MATKKNDSISSNFFNLLKSIQDYLINLFDLREDTDKEGTIEGVKKYIELKGYNVWILICAAVIASIGLDLNSAAVIIGAMLISPLMSPILGIGLAIGINDRETLWKSCQNFFIATIASIGTSCLYFYLTPFGYATPEILARTNPTLLDVGVALFGGIAGIVAGSHKDKTNALPGVAIATALMPPLCTVGFGLATSNWDIWTDALYLFFINAVIISFVTFLFVRMLRFPMKSYVTATERIRYNVLISIFVLIFICPSILILLNRIDSLQTQQNIRTLVDQINNDPYNDWTVIGRPVIYSEDSIPKIKVFIAGDFIPEDSLPKIENMLLNCSFGGYELNLTQSDVFSDEEREALLTEAKTQNQEIVLEVQKQIEERFSSIEQAGAKQLELDSIRAEQNRFWTIREEVEAMYPETKVMTEAFVPSKYLDADSVMQPLRISYLYMKWDEKLKKDKERLADYEMRIKRYIVTRFEYDSLLIVAHD